MKKKGLLSFEEMNDKEMDNILLELEDTQYWQAVLRYTIQRSGYADELLRTVDPFKEPTNTARAQGIRTGLWDLKEYIGALEEKRQENLKKDGDNG